LPACCSFRLVLLVLQYWLLVGIGKRADE
jgi:hypothetical protein